MAIKIQNSTIIDDSRNIVNAGITTVTSVSIGNTQVISSARQLQNIASLDATTTATIEAAITNAPNTFTDLQVTGVSTFTNGPVLIGAATSTGTAGQVLQVAGINSSAYIGGSVGIGITIPSPTGGASPKVHISGGNLKLDSSSTLVWDGTSPTYIRGISGSSGSLRFIVGNGSGIDFTNGAVGDFSPSTGTVDLGKSSSQFRNFWLSGTQVIGAATSTGTATQRLQVTGGAYVSSNTGIGNTNPTSRLTVSGDVLVSGVITATSFSGNSLTATYTTTAGVATYAGIAGIATYAVTAGVSTYAGVAGVSTFSGYSNTSGFSTFSGYSNTSGFSTFSGYANTAGIATYAVTSGVATYAGVAGVSTSVIGGIASVTQLNVTGVSTLTAISAGGTTGINQYVLTSTGTGLSWQSVTGIGAITGINIAPDSTNTASYIPFVKISTGTTATQYADTSLVYNSGTQRLGIGTTNPTSKLDVVGDAKFTGVVTATTFSGNATSATQLQTARTFEITGDIVASAISFNGTGNVSLAATIQPNSVALGSDTTGDYVQSISGTANQITVTSGTGEGSTPTLSIPNQFTAPQDVTVARDLQVNRNLNVNGSITIGGTSATLFTTELKISDPDIVLGFRTDANGNDISNDNTSNHGGVALASTEGTPLVQLFIAGIETNPATYKKIMWFKAGTFAGLGTDAWLSNYAVGIGSTQFPVGTRLAAGSVQFTENDLAVVRNINASGIITATTFRGNATSATSATYAGIAGFSTFSGYSNTSGFSTFSGYSNTSGFSTFSGYANNSGIATYTWTAGVSTYAGVSGVSTFSGYSNTSGFSTFSGYANVSGIATYAVTSGVSTYSGVSGFSTFSGYSNTSGFSTFSGYSNTSGFSTFSGYANVSGIATYAITAGVSTYAGIAGVSTSVIGGIASVTSLNATGISTIAGVQFTPTGIVTASTVSGIVTYYGDGSKLTGISAGAFNIINQPLTSTTVYPTFAANIGVASVGITSTQVAYIPSSNRLGIGTTNPNYTLEIVGNTRVSGLTSVTNLEIYGTVGAGNTVGNDGQYLKSTGVGVTWASFPTLRTTGITTATQGQTVFNFAYNVGFLDVYVNGVKLTNSEFTAVNGANVTLQSQAFSGDIVEFVSYNTVSTGSGSGGAGSISLDSLTDVVITNPQEGESLGFDGTYWINDYTFTTTTATSSQVPIHTLSSNDYRSVEYMIQVTNGTNYHLTKILVLHNGTTAYNTEYGTISTGPALATFDTDILGGAIRLLATPYSSSTMTYKIKFTAIKA